jgi:hypothetical protein
MRMLAEEQSDAFEYFNGAFAFVWYDSRKPNSVFISKNHERPLFYMIDRGGTTMVGCSELGMLGWIASRNHFRCAEKGKAHDHPYYIEDGKIYEFSLEKIGDFNETNAPRYDHRTTIYTGQTSSYPREEYGPPGFDDVWNDEDDLPFEQGTPATALTHYRGHIQEGMETWYYSRQEGILKAVKEALRPYRYTRDTLAETFAKADEEADRLLLEDDGEDQQIVDHDALEKAMHSAIQSQRREGNAFVRPVNDLIESGDLILHTVNPSAATRGEIENAKDRAMFGMVVNFEGIEFDATTGTEIGLFRVKDTDGSSYVFDSEMRFLTSAVSEGLYHNKKSMAIVIGCSLKLDGDIDLVVVAQPTPEQRRFCLNQAGKFAGSEMTTAH